MRRAAESARRHSDNFAEMQWRNLNRAVLGLLIFIGCSTSQAAKIPAVGQAAPDFTVTTLDGKKLSLGDFKGQVLVINFWATWCGPCRQELPLLNSYFNLQAAEGLRILAVTTEDSAPLSQLKRLAAVVNFPMARQMRGPYEAIRAVPTNYVIDRRGILRYAKAGAFDLDALNEILVPLLRESPGDEPNVETTGLILPDSAPTAVN
jgi:cytochrome c biogenesis protein CcmG, thiol:disulfide interchange protein DsbE